MRLQLGVFFVCLRNPRYFSRCNSWCCDASFHRFIQGLDTAEIGNNYMLSVLMYWFVLFGPASSVEIVRSPFAQTLGLPRESNGPAHISWRRTRLIPGNSSLHILLGSVMLPPPSFHFLLFCL